MVIAVLAVVRIARRDSQQNFLQQLFNRDKTPSSLTTTTAVGDVPPEYKALYDKIDGKLTSFNRKLSSEWSGNKSSVIFSATLAPTNPNLGDTLLSAETYNSAITYVDRLQQLGVRAITIDINFPLLDPDFRGPEKSAQYLEFYKKLVGEIKNRGLSVTIEIQPIFPDFSPLPVKKYYDTLTVETYKQRAAQMNKTVALELRPAYLTVANEPETAARNLSLPVGNIETAVDEVKYILSELDKLGLDNIKYGAGFGNWQADYQNWAQRYTQLPNLDFLNIHIYPVDGDLLNRILTIDDIAKKYGKRLAVHEAWLYKWQIGERTGNMAASAGTFAKDSYSFWQPLDAKFMETLYLLGESRNFEYVSPFWSNFFFGYFDYNEVKNISGTKMMGNMISAGSTAAKQGKITETGRKYQTLISK
ncbi:MAG: hypothetical protein A3J09_02605 [Candidatus Zambryskibacteria bacterium RIFCSPLOWO2_02_FULL_51_21]|uniref:Xylose isomerase-like TIM barrel domain-containing protein n=1 Tax=Candidatus Zambryskibacteria bacterium RIFCSPHIGHO2_02_FULL_43_37 TaxID=1802749 RepID=A0A1G2TG99_9BACT|nr:MAG: hypothetical protein A2723_02595 [Candidatus Zambryskibacteria bacterium RIFCSPHIGHO2_01_FULL_52_18]OHA96324.1 MAG: hypothetical protein A3D49_00295 [Candidatus Zambryskibacteria bacterium RIFCSPHIGHO2_02_FULL_43_37]OHB07727.1 MAG: hypothetical protein A2944_00170 [Candidatus Zambryskibacteria bacterium RIFCSPLOWO2_01_FULL_52_12]OHB11417.1 MAG: hypothetical protein A3J09_02605 [Candidatus Zambryskibacteria bacterium RIFCSPLOWO2_02_FULL_51_21]